MFWIKQSKWIQFDLYSGSGRRRAGSFPQGSPQGPGCRAGGRVTVLARGPRAGEALVALVVQGRLGGPMLLTLTTPHTPHPHAPPWPQALHTSPPTRSPATPTRPRPPPAPPTSPPTPTAHNALGR